MTRPIIRIHNLETNEVIDREMNDEEFAKWQKVSEEIEIQKATELEAAAKRQALLDKLGITEDEARLLLGGN